MQEAVTIPTNLVTVFHTLTADLGFELPWPNPQDYKPEHSATPILIWGGSSSVGQYAIQVLRYYGHEAIVAVSSKRQHALLHSLGAAHVIDYSVPLDTLLADLGHLGEIPYILDCIGSQSGSVYPISKIARRGTRVAVMLPVIVRDAAVDVEPVYSMEVGECAEWREGVDVRGVRTHFYLQNEFFAGHLQPDIMPALVEEGVVRPNRYRVVEGETMLERAQRALDMLRGKEVSGEKLVWRVSEGEAV